MRDNDTKIRLLLDENMPHQFSHQFTERFEIMTVQKMGWGGIKNNKLLELAANAGFRALIEA